MFARFTANFFRCLLRNRRRVVLRALARLVLAFTSPEAHSEDFESLTVALVLRLYSEMSTPAIEGQHGRATFIYWRWR